MFPTSRNRVQSIPYHLTLLNIPLRTLVHSIFSRSINFVWEETLYSVSSSQSPGVHSIVLENEVNFLEWVTPQTFIEIRNDEFIVGNRSFHILPQSMVEMFPHQKKYELSRLHVELIYELEQRIKEERTLSVFSFDNNDKTLATQMSWFMMFLQRPTVIHACRILGLGQGLTPLGDDILFGHILAMNCFENNLPYIQHIQSKLNQTVRISAQMLEDVYQRHYSVIYREFLDSFFLEYRWKHLDEILSFGASSGVGILTGFLFGLKKEMTNERI